MTGCRFSRSNLTEAANLLRGKSCGSGEFSLSVYPSSQPVFINLTRQGYAADLDWFAGYTQEDLFRERGEMLETTREKILAAVRAARQ